MRKLKLKNLLVELRSQQTHLFAIMVALTLVSCAKDSSVDDEGTGYPKTTISGSTPPSSGSYSSTPPPSNTTPPPVGSTGVGQTNPNGCPANPSRSYYSYGGLIGTGTGSVSTVYKDIIADQKLRVSVRPNSSPGNGTSYGDYSKMALTVTLLSDGFEVPGATVKLPNPDKGYQGNYNFKRGITVGYKTNPSLVDFSGFLSGNHKYSIKISGVMTDQRCKKSCTLSNLCSPPAFYGNQSTGPFPPSYCDYHLTDWSTGIGYQYNYDYNSNLYYCCVGKLVETCQQEHCGVGNLNLAGLSNTTWSVDVYVETDSTTCIP